MLQLLLTDIFFAEQVGAHTNLLMLGMLIAAIAAALVLDRLLGEPARLHPLVGFGHMIGWVERHLNLGSDQKKCLLGFLGWCLLTLPITLVCVLILCWILSWSMLWFYFTSVVLLYLTVGLKSLEQHASWVSVPLAQGNIEEAKAKVAWLVSRQTQTMSETEINKACIESVLENGNDAVFGSLVWFLVAGAPGAVLYRLANTLDASWGYRNKKYRNFGWWSARSDDWLNLIPARICAACYALCGNYKNALESWRQINLWRKGEGKGFASPNAGVVMSSGAGALCLRLGGAAVYDNERVLKPPLGIGELPEVQDIDRSVSLLKRAVNLFVILSIILFALVSLCVSHSPT